MKSNIIEKLKLPSMEVLMTYDTKLQDLVSQKLLELLKSPNITEVQDIIALDTFYKAFEERRKIVEKIIFLSDEELNNLDTKELSSLLTETELLLSTDRGYSVDEIRKIQNYKETIKFVGKMKAMNKFEVRLLSHYSLPSREEMNSMTPEELKVVKQKADKISAVNNKETIKSVMNEYVSDLSTIAIAKINARKELRASKVNNVPKKIKVIKTKVKRKAKLKKVLLTIALAGTMLLQVSSMSNKTSQSYDTTNKIVSEVMQPNTDNQLEEESTQYVNEIDENEIIKTLNDSGIEIGMPATVVEEAAPVVVEESVPVVVEEAAPVVVKEASPVVVEEAAAVTEQSDRGSLFSNKGSKEAFSGNEVNTIAAFKNNTPNAAPVIFGYPTNVTIQNENYVVYSDDSGDVIAVTYAGDSIFSNGSSSNEMEFLSGNTKVFKVSNLGSAMPLSNWINNNRDILAGPNGGGVNYPWLDKILAGQETTPDSLEFFSNTMAGYEYEQSKNK